MRARPRVCVCDHAVFVGGRKTFVGGHEYSMHRLYWSRIFRAFSKFKRGMPAVNSMTTPLRVMLRVDSVVIFVLAINSLKMKQMAVFFYFAVPVVEPLSAEMISK